MKFTKLRNGVLRSADELGINYIENGDAELASPAPSLYADSGTRPVDGTGGSVNTSTELDFYRSTSSPLRGSASWVFDKKSGDQQGKGGAFPFTIDVADKGKQASITFDYSVLSGTYATGNVAVYIVHDPSGTPKVIQPSAFNIENVGVESLARLTFQTEYSSVLDYRLCFHVASTSASAYSLKFDNIVLGPQVVPMGAPVTDAVAKTTFGSWVSNTTYTMYETQIGDTAFYRVRLTLSGAPTSAALTVNLPAGRVIDTAKITSTTASYLGSGVIRDNDTSNRYNVNVQYNSTTSVFLQAILPASGSTHVTATVDQANPITFAASDSIDFTFSVPIVGWSSSTVVSSSADTRVVAGSNGKASAQAITATTYGTAQKVTYNATPILDSHGMWDSANNRWVVKVPGRYRITAPLAYAATTAEVSAIALLRQNTADIHQAYLSKSASTNSNAATCTLEAIVNASAGDYFEVFTYHPAPAGSLDILGNTSVAQVRFMIEMLQGPSQIQASEIIACRAYLSANQTGVNTNNSQVKVNFNATTLDTHNTFNTSTYRYVAPAPGIYEVATTIYTASSNVLANTYHPVIYVNGAEVQYGHPVPSIASVATGGYANWIGQLNAGDYVEIYWYGAGNNSASTMTIYGPNGTKNSSVHIKRLGGV